MNNENLELLWLALSHGALFLAIIGLMIQSYQKYRFSNGCWISVIVCLLAPSLMLLIIPLCEYTTVRKRQPNEEELRKVRNKLATAGILFATYCILFLIFNISLNSSYANTTWNSEIAYVHTNIVLLAYVLNKLIFGKVNQKL